MTTAGVGHERAAAAYKAVLAAQAASKGRRKAAVLTHKREATAVAMAKSGAKANKAPANKAPAKGGGHVP